MSEHHHSEFNLGPRTRGNLSEPFNGLFPPADLPSFRNVQIWFSDIWFDRISKRKRNSSWNNETLTRVTSLALT
jgi:hypothetical protein